MESIPIELLALTCVLSIVFWALLIQAAVQKRWHTIWLAVSLALLGAVLGFVLTAANEPTLVLPTGGDLEIGNRGVLSYLVAMILGCVAIVAAAVVRTHGGE